MAIMDDNFIDDDQLDPDPFAAFHEWSAKKMISLSPISNPTKTAEGPVTC